MTNKANKTDEQRVARIVVKIGRDEGREVKYVRALALARLNPRPCTVPVTSREEHAAALYLRITGAEP